MDFVAVPTLTAQMLFVLALLTHHRRRIIHFAITDHPTAAWTTQQIIEVFPGETAATHHRARTHLSLEKDAPTPRHIHVPADGQRL